MQFLKPPENGIYAKGFELSLSFSTECRSGLNSREFSQIVASRAMK